MPGGKTTAVGGSPMVVCGQTKPAVHKAWGRAGGGGVRILEDKEKREKKGEAFTTHYDD